jgi:pimeloyl-ACP methyl ester carboxylesterase
MFRIINDRQPARLVIVSGWAFDWRPFARLSLPLGCAVYTGENLQDFAADLHRWLKLQNCKTIALLGWSMGAYAVADFAVHHPALVDQLILVAARCRYGPREIEPIRTHLHQRRKAFLGKFYRDCFSAREETAYRWFRTTLLRDYLDQMTAARLNRGLDWLSRARLDTDRLQSCTDLVLVHGTADRIASPKDGRQLAQALPRARAVWLSDTGHLPFLSSEFAEQVYGKTKPD